jgi:mRNA interferase MazF
MVINQGDIYWLNFRSPYGSEPGYRRPHVVIQNNAYNHSPISTVIVCAITTNLERAGIPGNVLLVKGEGALPRRSVVIVSQISSVDKNRLVEKIGTLSSRRVQDVLRGLSMALEPREYIL